MRPATQSAGCAPWLLLHPVGVTAELDRLEHPDALGWGTLLAALRLERSDPVRLRLARLLTPLLPPDERPAVEAALAAWEVGGFSDRRVWRVVSPSNAPSWALLYVLAPGSTLASQVYQVREEVGLAPVVEALLDLSPCRFDAPARACFLAILSDRSRTAHSAFRDARLVQVLSDAGVCPSPDFLSLLAASPFLGVDESWSAEAFGTAAGLSGPGVEVFVRLLADRCPLDRALAAAFRLA